MKFVRIVFGLICLIPGMFVLYCVAVFGLEIFYIGQVNNQIGDGVYLLFAFGTPAICGSALGLYVLATEIPNRFWIKTANFCGALALLMAACECLFLIWLFGIATLQFFQYGTTIPIGSLFKFLFLIAVSGLLPFWAFGYPALKIRIPSKA